jgi:hypothetical protein
VTKKQKQAEAILQHGFKLQRIFPQSKQYGPVDLCKKLHRIEAAAHRRAEDECSFEVDTDAYDRADERALDRLDAILGYRALGVPVFLNGDPRGYALKIRDEYVREHNLDIHRDWGGYGILCPEF